MLSAILTQPDTSTLPSVLIVSAHVNGVRHDYVYELPKHLKDLPPGYAFVPYKLTCIGRINAKIMEIEFWPRQQHAPPLEQMADIIWMISFISIPTSDRLRAAPNLPPTIFELNQIQVSEACFNNMLLGLTSKRPRRLSNVIAVGKSLVSALTMNIDKLTCPHCGAKLYLHTPYVRIVDDLSDLTSRANHPADYFIYDENSNTIKVPYEVPRALCSSCAKKFKDCPEVLLRENDKYLTYALFDPHIFIPYLPYHTQLLMMPEFLKNLEELMGSRLTAITRQLLKLLTHLAWLFKEMAVSLFRDTVKQQHLLPAAATHAEIASLDLKVPVNSAGIVFSGTYQKLARGKNRFSTEVFWGEKGRSLLYEVLRKYLFFEGGLNCYEEEKIHPR